MSVANITAVLQYGALGLLSLVIGGLFWYVRNTEARAMKREEAEHGRQEKYINALVESAAAMAVMTSTLQAHDRRMQEEHEAIMNACRFSQRGIGE